MTARSALAQRVENSPTTSSEQAVERPTAAAMLESMSGQFARALPAHIPADRFVRLALTALRKNPALGRCSPQSFLGALMTCAQLGLEPNTPTGEAYLIPYGDECTFVPGYQGLVKLAWQSGAIAEVYAEVVRERDTFTFRKGLHRDLVHEPFLAGDAGKVVGAYAVIRLVDGGVAFDYWPIDVIKAHQQAHSKRRRGQQIADTAHWMERKTVLRQVLKLVPKSTNVNLALAHDGVVRTDVDLSAIDVVPDEPDVVEVALEAEVVDEILAETGAEVTS